MPIVEAMKVVEVSLQQPGVLKPVPMRAARQAAKAQELEPSAAVLEVAHVAFDFATEQTDSDC